MNHVKRGRCFVQFAQKVTALLLVLTLVFALPITAQATDDVPEGAVRVIPFLTFVGRPGPDAEMASVPYLGFDILNVTHQRVVHSVEDMQGLPGYDIPFPDAFPGGADGQVRVFYVDAPAIVTMNLDSTMQIPWFDNSGAYPFFDNINLQVRNYVLCGECSDCERGHLDCWYADLTGHLIFNQPGA